MRFDPRVGAEIPKTRLALVIQNDPGNDVGPVTIVAAISSQVPDEPSPVDVVVPAGEGGLRVASVVLLNHLHSCDRRRFSKRLGTLGPETMRRVDRVLAISVGLPRDLALARERLEASTSR
ncbi:MAG: type II toxin-antitoxin system PemK/MazF family toxin [Deltaproteobacteria bacterium]|nr:type II toxin-antitoxin system PemK/MazF family toxin [Deltaproteobacteria bacterium]